MQVKRTPRFAIRAHLAHPRRRVGRRAWLIAPLAVLRDAYGNCLQSMGPSANADYKVDAWSQVVTRTCDGSDLQQWNVPATVSAGPLKDLGEQ